MTADPSWTVFDPHLCIDTYPNEYGSTVVITHLPTGMQEAEGMSTSQIINRAKAMARLRHRVP
jgi:protein subunit release factor A